MRDCRVRLILKRKKKELEPQFNSPHWESNPGPTAYKTVALPLSYKGTQLYLSTLPQWPDVLGIFKMILCVRRYAAISLL